MKKFDEILNDIAVVREELKALENERDAESVCFHEQVKDMTREKLKEFSELSKEHNVKMDTLYKKIKHREIKIKLMQNNARIALFHEVMPVALEIFGKYVGKPYGEKTREKIKNEILEKTNCFVYVAGYTFRIVPSDMFGNTYYLECGTTLGNDILVGNKIQSVSMEDVKIFFMNTNYVEDFAEVISEMERLHEEAKQKQEELKNICSQYNALAVKGISELEYTKYIY